MTEWVRQTASVCGGLLLLEAAARLAPRQRLVAVVKALGGLLLLGTVAASLLFLEWEPVWPNVSAEATELTAYLEDRARAAADRDAERYLKGLLNAADIPVKKISVKTTIREDGSIQYTSVWASFRYGSDARRGQVLLTRMLAEGATVEVTADDG